MKLKLKYNDKDYVLEDIDVGATVTTLKAAAGKATGIEPSRIRLVYMGRVLKDDQTISTYNVEDETTVHMIAKEPTFQQTSPPPQQSQPRTSSPPAAGANTQSTSQSHFSFESSGMEGGALPPEAGAALGNIFSMLGPALSGLGPALAGWQQQAAATAGRAGRSSPSTTSPQRESEPAASARQPSSQESARPAEPSQPSRASTAARDANEERVDAPPVAGIHVHIHVTLDELEALPERLERFSRRVPNTTSIHIERPDQPGMAQNVFRSVPAHLQRVWRSAGAAMGGGGAGASGATGVPAAAAELFREAASADQPRRSMRNVAQTFGMDADTSGASQSVFDLLSSELMDGADSRDMMGLIAGDWSSTRKAYLPLRKFIMTATNNNPTPDARKKLAIRTARGAGKQLTNTDTELGRELRRRQRPGVDAARHLEIAIQHAALELIDKVVDSDADAFPRNLRSVLVRHLGHTYDYVKRNFFQGGQADCDALLQMAIQRAMQKALAAKPEYAMMANMAAPMAMNVIRQWHQEYLTSHRSPNDDRNWIETPLQEPSTVQDESCTAGDEEDMLDSALEEAMEEACNAAGSSSSSRAAPQATPQASTGGAAAAFAEALGQTGIPNGENIMRMFTEAMRMQREHTPRESDLREDYTSFYKKE